MKSDITELPSLTSCPTNKRFLTLLGCYERVLSEQVADNANVVLSSNSSNEMNKQTRRSYRAAGVQDSLVANGLALKVYLTELIQ